MKRILLFFILSLFYQVLFASYPEEDITWLSEDEAYSVTTAHHSIAYEMRGKPSYYTWRATWNNKFRVRKVIPYDSYKQKKIKKTTTFIVRGYVNKAPQLSYDTYVIEIKDVLYLLPSQYVSQDSRLTKINNELAKEYKSLIDAEQRYKEKIENLIAQTISEYEDSLSYYRTVKYTYPGIIESIEKSISDDFKRMETEELDGWINSLPASTKRIYTNVLDLDQATLHSPNSVGGCDCSIYYQNKSSKTIKYLYWTGSFYNAVGDYVRCEIRGSSSFTGKDTGPVSSGEWGGGTWDCVIYDWSADYVTLSDISITYMDGSSVSIGALDIKHLLTKPKLTLGSDRAIRKYGGSESYVIRKKTQPYKDKLKNCDYEIKKWTDRLELLYEREIRIPFGAPDDNHHSAKIKAISSLYSSLYSTRESISKFRSRNFLYMTSDDDL